MAPAIRTYVNFKPGQPAPKLVPVDLTKSVFLPWPVLSLGITLLIVAINSWERVYESTIYMQTVSRDFFDSNIIEEYDYVIIGGGSAGAVIMNRLSKNPETSVLCLEAGGVPNPIMLWPVMAYVGQLLIPAVDWMFQTLPLVNTSLGLNGQRVRIPRGKGLGGSSNLNLMYYQRGNRRDFDNWADITGDEEWSFENVLPFFKSSENYHGHNPSEKFHRVSPNEEGLYVGQTPPYGIPEFLSAAAEKGYHVEDPNANQRESFSRMDVTIKNGKRASTYEGFVRPIANRNNLKIYLYSRAIKIHLDRSRTAYGVTYIRHGVKKFVRARREIILSAGSIDSPKLLLLSGIGPKPHLHSVGLKCRVNLPVGHNFQDHPLSIIGPFTVDEGKSPSFEKRSNIDTLRDYFTNRMGFISTPDASSGVGYVVTKLGEKDWPDIQYTLVGASIMVPLLGWAHNLKPGLWEKYGEPYRNNDSFGFGMVLGLPRSRGEVRLASKNYQDKPIIDARYFDHEDDMKIMVDGMRILVDLVETTEAYRKINAKFATTAFPGCEHIVDLRSEEYYECFLRYTTYTVHHPSCTVPMGKSVNDYPAVLDSKLRVFKTSRLRVVDASVMPKITNANLNAPVVMIADKASYFIRDYWASQFQVCVISEFLLNNFDAKCYYSRLP